MNVDDVKDDNERKSERIQWDDVPTLLLNWIFEKFGLTGVAVIRGGPHRLDS
ncbi:hypothetical protein MJD09_14830 [bacterium]|nr:hypothetical protein [bacterium]